MKTIKDGKGGREERKENLIKGICYTPSKLSRNHWSISQFQPLIMTVGWEKQLRNCQEIKKEERRRRKESDPPSNSFQAWIKSPRGNNTTKKSLSKEKENSLFLPSVLDQRTEGGGNPSAEQSINAVLLFNTNVSLGSMIHFGGTVWDTKREELLELHDINNLNYIPCMIMVPLWTTLPAELLASHV